MGKRGQGEGSITKRADGRWMARLTLPGGKRKCFYGRTRQEVARKLAKAQRDLEMGVRIPSERQVFGQFLAQWLEVARPTVRITTFIRYEEYVRLHTVPILGRIKLTRLTPQHLQELYARKLEDGLSPMSVRHLHAVLHRALSQALRWGLIASNVAGAVDPPRAKRMELQTLNPDQARRFLEVAKGHRLEALYVVALTTGMRLGEILGLRWKDVDLDGSCLRIVCTLQRTPSALTFAEPKTDNSRRQIDLTQAAVAALRRHRASQLEERLKAGPVWEDNGMVFANEVGRPIDGGNLRCRSFLPLLKRAGLPCIRFHDLRHSAATLLLSQGIHPKIVSEMLGHSSITMTLDIYSHVLPTMQRQATAALDALLQT